MHKRENGTWKENRLAVDRRPFSLPEEWGALWFAIDVVDRCDNPEVDEPLHFLAVSAHDYLLNATPWPTQGTEPDWSELDVSSFIGALMHDEGDALRVAEVISQLDLLADYLVAVGAIDDDLRTTWIERAQRAVDELVSVH